MSASGKLVIAKPTKPLTARQQALWDMAQPAGDGTPGRTRTDIAKELGISVPVVSKTLAACRKKLGITDAKDRADRRRELDVLAPEQFAARLDVATEPDKLRTVRQALVDAGISEKAAEAYVARLKRRYPGVLAAGKALKTAELADLLDRKLDMALNAIDEHVILEASFRDLALGATAMIEKRQLLRGQPTAITSDLERKKLVELTPLLLAEAKRRGITIEGTATVVQEMAA